MKIAVIGYGSIGSKLVEYLAGKSIDLVVVTGSSAEEKADRFFNGARRDLRLKKIDEESCHRLLTRIEFTTDVRRVHDCQVVMECFKEDYEVKKALYGQLRNIVSKETVVCTTTSSLSLEKLGAFFDEERFAGVHFFNPPTRMRLIEVSYPAGTSPHTRAIVTDLLKSFDDKKVIELPPIQGYIVNNLLFASINFAIGFMVENGLTAKEIDMAMKLGTNAPMGPIELSDFVGNDTSLQILTELFDASNDFRFKPSPLLVKMVEEGRLGKKTKSGFYTY